MNNIEVQIEIQQGQNIKYEIDHKTNKLVCDRVLHGPFRYPFNYGYIINTLGGDGDPLDAIVISKYSFYPTCYINCKIIGALITNDEKGNDEKIILVPIESIDPSTSNITELNHLDEHTLEEIKYFFEHYKDLEPNKFINVDKFIDSKEAFDLYNKYKLTH